MIYNGLIQEFGPFERQRQAVLDARDRAQHALAELEASLAVVGAGPDSPEAQELQSSVGAANAWRAGIEMAFQCMTSSASSSMSDVAFFRFCFYSGIVGSAPEDTDLVAWTRRTAAAENEEVDGGRNGAAPATIEPSTCRNVFTFATQGGASMSFHAFNLALVHCQHMLTQHARRATAAAATEAHVVSTVRLTPDSLANIFAARLRGLFSSRVAGLVALHSCSYPFPEKFFRERLCVARVLWRYSEGLEHVFDRYTHGGDLMSLGEFETCFAEFAIIPQLSVAHMHRIFFAVVDGTRRRQSRAAGSLMLPPDGPAAATGEASLDFDQFLEVIARVACEILSDETYSRWLTLDAKTEHFLSSMFASSFYNVFGGALPKEDGEPPHPVIMSIDTPHLRADNPETRVTVRGKYFAAIGRGVWVYDTASNSTTHLETTTSDEELTFVIVPSSSVSWQSAKIAPLATDPGLRFSYTLSTPLHLAAANAPEDMPFFASLVAVGDLSMEFQDIVLEPSTARLAHERFLEGCRRSSAYNTKHLYEGNFHFLVDKYDLHGGPHNVHALGMAAATEAEVPQAPKVEVAASGSAAPDAHLGHERRGAGLPATHQRLFERLATRPKTDGVGRASLSFVSFAECLVRVALSQGVPPAEMGEAIWRMLGGALRDPLPASPTAETPLCHDSDASPIAGDASVPGGTLHSSSTENDAASSPSQSLAHHPGTPGTPGATFGNRSNHGEAKWDCHSANHSEGARAVSGGNSSREQQQQQRSVQEQRPARFNRVVAFQGEGEEGDNARKRSTRSSLDAADGVKRGSAAEADGRRQTLRDEALLRTMAIERKQSVSLRYAQGAVKAQLAAALQELQRWDEVHEGLRLGILEIKSFCDLLLQGGNREECTGLPALPTLHLASANPKDEDGNSAEELLNALCTKSAQQKLAAVYRAQLTSVCSRALDALTAVRRDELLLLGPGHPSALCPSSPVADSQRSDPSQLPNGSGSAERRVSSGSTPPVQQQQRQPSTRLDLTTMQNEIVQVLRDAHHHAQQLARKSEGDKSTVSGASKYDLLEQLAAAEEAQRRARAEVSHLQGELSMQREKGEREAKRLAVELDTALDAQQQTMKQLDVMTANMKERDRQLQKMKQALDAANRKLRSSEEAVQTRKASQAELEHMVHELQQRLHQVAGRSAVNAAASTTTAGAAASRRLSQLATFGAASAGVRRAVSPPLTESAGATATAAAMAAAARERQLKQQLEQLERAAGDARRQAIEAEARMVELTAQRDREIANSEYIRAERDSVERLLRAVERWTHVGHGDIEHLRSLLIGFGSSGAGGSSIFDTKQLASRTAEKASPGAHHRRQTTRSGDDGEQKCAVETPLSPDSSSKQRNATERSERDPVQASEQQKQPLQRRRRRPRREARRMVADESGCSSLEGSDHGVWEDASVVGSPARVGSLQSRVSRRSAAASSRASTGVSAAKKSGRAAAQPARRHPAGRLPNIQSSGGRQGATTARQVQNRAEKNQKIGDAGSVSNASLTMSSTTVRSNLDRAPSRSGESSWSDTPSSHDQPVRPPYYFVDDAAVQTDLAAAGAAVASSTSAGETNVASTLRVGSSSCSRCSRLLLKLRGIRSDAMRAKFQLSEIRDEADALRTCCRHKTAEMRTAASQGVNAFREAMLPLDVQMRRPTTGTPSLRSLGPGCSTSATQTPQEPQQLQPPDAHAAEEVLLGGSVRAAVAPSGGDGVESSGGGSGGMGAIPADIATERPTSTAAPSGVGGTATPSRSSSSLSSMSVASTAMPGTVETLSGGVTAQYEGAIAPARAAVPSAKAVASAAVQAPDDEDSFPANVVGMRQDVGVQCCLLVAADKHKIAHQPPQSRLVGVASGTSNGTSRRLPTPSTTAPAPGNKVESNTAPTRAAAAAPAIVLPLEDALRESEATAALAAESWADAGSLVTADTMLESPTRVARKAQPVLARRAATAQKKQDQRLIHEAPGASCGPKGVVQLGLDSSNGGRTARLSPQRTRTSPKREDVQMVTAAVLHSRSAADPDVERQQHNPVAAPGHALHTAAATTARPMNTAAFEGFISCSNSDACEPEDTRIAFLTGVSICRAAADGVAVEQRNGPGEREALLPSSAAPGNANRSQLKEGERSALVVSGAGAFPASCPRGEVKEVAVDRGRSRQQVERAMTEGRRHLLGCNAIPNKNEKDRVDATDRTNFLEERVLYRDEATNEIIAIPKEQWVIAKRAEGLLQSPRVGGLQQPSQKARAQPAIETASAVAAARRLTTATGYSHQNRTTRLANDSTDGTLLEAMMLAQAGAAASARSTTTTGKPLLSHEPLPPSLQPRAPTAPSVGPNACLPQPSRLNSATGRPRAIANAPLVKPPCAIDTRRLRPKRQRFPGAMDDGDFDDDDDWGQRRGLATSGSGVPGQRGTTDVAATVAAPSGLCGAQSPPPQVRRESRGSDASSASDGTIFTMLGS